MDQSLFLMGLPFSLPGVVAEEGDDVFQGPVQGSCDEFGFGANHTEDRAGTEGGGRDDQGGTAVDGMIGEVVEERLSDGVNYRAEHHHRGEAVEAAEAGFGG